MKNSHLPQLLVSGSSPFQVFILALSRKAAAKLLILFLTNTTSSL